MGKTEKPVLSISLLSCGTEPHIEDCLKGLMPLKKHLGAQIVIVDTSAEKSGGVRETIERYSDEVVDFDWCDDFAAARNAGLNRCNGEWFMFVDDDEVLIESDAIIEFFTNGDYKNYASASIILKNYGDEVGTKHFDNWIPRLHRRPKNARFENRIHEHYIPAEYPIKALHAFAVHYGYIFRTKEEFLAHSDRNLRLLEKELVDHPEDIHMRIHYLQEYVRKRDFDRQQEIALDCINRLKGHGDRQSQIYRGLCYSLLLRANRLQGKYDDAKKLLVKLKKRKNNNPVVRAFFAQEGARIYDALDDIEASKAEANEYLAIYHDIKDEMDQHSDELSFFLASTFDEENLPDMMGIAEGRRPPERLGIQTLQTEDDEAFILGLSFEDWKTYIDRFMDNATTKELADRYSEIRSRQEHDDIRYEYFYSRIDEKMLVSWVRQYDKVLPEKPEDIQNAYILFRERLLDFCIKALRFYEKYGDFITDENIREDTLKRSDMAIKLLPVMLLDKVSAGTLLGTVREALGHYSPLDPVLSYFAHLYGANAKQDILVDDEEQKNAIKEKQNPLFKEPSVWKLAERGEHLMAELLSEMPFSIWKENVDAFITEAADEYIMKMLGIFDSYPDNLATNYARRQMRQHMIETWMKYYQEQKPNYVCRTLYGRNALIIQEIDDFMTFINEQSQLFERDVRLAMSNTAISSSGG